MKRRYSGNCVELSLAPHPARAGWEVVRLTYDAHNPRHLTQIEATLTALAKARYLVDTTQHDGEPVRTAS
jgi:hypothetical protein